MLQRWLRFDPSDRYLETIRVNNLLLASRDGVIVGCAGLYLPRNELIATFVHPDCTGTGVGRLLLTAVEDRSREFGVPQLRVESAVNATPFYQACGYLLNTATEAICSQRTGMVVDAMEKVLSGGFSVFQQRILSLLESINIPLDYGITHMLPMQREASELTGIGADVFDRQQMLLLPAAAAWRQMRRQALLDQVELLPVSAFRSIDYQAELLQRKLSQGERMAEILSVSAAPGFSEHHSGRAIDIASNRENALEESFEASTSFNWLLRNAAEYGFSLSYARDNPHAIAYEPWHWAWQAT